MDMDDRSFNNRVDARAPGSSAIQLAVRCSAAVARGVGSLATEFAWILNSAVYPNAPALRS